MRQAARLIGWDEKRAHRHPNRGLGIAASCMVSGKRSHHYDGSSGIVIVNGDGTVQVLSGEGETGPGSRTVLAQIVAEELGVRYADVSVSAADTATTTFAFGTHASRSTYIAGNAARDAARRAREQLLEVAAEMLEASAADLQIKDGVVSVRGVPPEARSATVGEVATRALFRPGGSPISAAGSWDPPSTDLDQEWYGNESGAYNFCAQAVEVEVDPESGQVKILNMAMASDAGTVIHPVACEGQNEGALAQGLGYAYIEQPQMEDGRLANPSLAGYRIPCVADMPPFSQVFVPSYEPTGPFGAKGVGQIGLDPTAPAIANAICDAVGARVTRLPISPEDIWQALHGE